MKTVSTNRVYYRRLANGTVVGPTHTRAYLRHLVWVYKMNEETKEAASLRGDAGLD